MTQETRKILRQAAKIGILCICFAGTILAVFEARERSARFDEVKFERVANKTLSDFSPQTTRVSVASDAPSVHSASAVELPDGTIRAFWFGGSREGVPDVKIWSADFDGESWRNTRVVVDPETVGRGTRRYVRKLGNPVAHLAKDGRIHLFVVSVSYGGWSGSAVNRVVFDEEGEEIERVDRLVASPGLNLGTLVRGAPLETTGSEVILPAYHELLRKFPQMLRVGDDGRVSGRVNLPFSNEVFQPWAVVSGQRRVELFLRRGSREPPFVFHTRSEDGGEHWEPHEAIAFGNPDSAVSVLLLDGGNYLLAANSGQSWQRDTLVLVRRAKPKGAWDVIYEVDTPLREEDEASFGWVDYSYPWLLRDRLGVIHLFYTWNRREIRHLRIGQRQLLNGQGGNL